MVLDLTAFDPILKSHYVKKRIWHLAELKNPFYSKVSRNKKAGGKHIVQPIDFENPTGGSADIAKAISNTGASNYEDFVITRSKNYQVALIDNETIHASMENENAFLPALKEISKAFKAAGRRDAWQLYRTSGGAKGRLESGTTLTGAVANLDDHADAFNFQVGEKVAFAENNGTGALRDSGAVLTVSAIDRENGQITFSANLNTVTGIADTDYMFADGDFGANAAGLGSWLPTDRSVLTTAYFGVTRSEDEDRLGGIYRDSTGEPIDEALQKLTASVAKHGGAPDYAFMNPETLSDLLLIVGAKSRYEMTVVKGQAQIGFKGFNIVAGGREITCVGDVNCPTNLLYVLQMDTWTLHSAGESPMFLDRDGLLQRSTNADSYEVRVGGYRNLGCSAPGYNGVAKLA